MKIEIELPDKLLKLVDESAEKYHIYRNKWIELALADILLHIALEKQGNKNNA